MKKIISLILVLSVFLSVFAGMSIYAAEEKVLHSQSFEGLSGTKLPEGWTFFGTSDYCSYDNTRATQGKTSAYIEDKAEDSSGGFNSPLFEAVAGKEYSVLADVYVVEGFVTVFLKFFDANKKQISYKSSSSKKIDTWNEVAISLPAPEGTKYVGITLAGTNAGISVGAVDNVKIVEGTVSVSQPVTTVKAVKPTVVTPTSIVDREAIYTQNFEDISGTTLPKAWGHFGKGYEMYSVSSERISDGKNSAFISDKSDVDTGGLSSPYIEAEAGKTYSVSGDIYLLDGRASIFLKFYDADKKQVASKTISTSNKQMWTTIGTSNVAPEGTKYVACVLGGTTDGITVAHYDNITFYNGIVAFKPVKVASPFVAPSQKDAVNSKLVVPEGDKLTYNAYNNEGDKLSDFSYAGFYAGKYELPDTDKLPLAATIEPSADPNADDTKRIQAVIDKVYNEATNDFMKVIKLKAGKYNINDTGLYLRSGIVLSGEGQGPTGTILYATAKKQHVVIKVHGSAPAAKSDKANILDDYLKSGSNKFSIESEKIADYKVGDLITIHHPSTLEWVKAMEMVDIKDSYNDVNSWRKDSVDFFTERTITAIEGNTITVDFPVFVPYNKAYSQSYIYKISDDLRIQHVGIENLRIESYYNGNFDDEEHAYTGIEIKNAKNCFVRNYTGKHLIFAAVNCVNYAKQITVTNCSNIEPVSQVAGNRRYSFGAMNSAQQVLFENCYSYDSRHDFATSRQVTGPIVFQNCVNDSGNDSSEPHATWSTGVLYDNLLGVGSGTGGYLAMSNRGRYGTDLSQGWTVAGGVIWNALQTLTVVHKPPLTYQNFMIGAWGVYTDEESKTVKTEKAKSVVERYRTTHVGAGGDKSAFALTTDDTHYVGDSYLESPTAPVEPRSLFKAQLAERITGSYKNAKPNSPVIISPRTEATLKETFVNFEGLAQKGATKVTMYIDDKPYDAELNTNDFTFKFGIELEKGTHKVYATQVIDGVESVKCVDKFVIVSEIGENKDYLSSKIDFNKTGFITNDNRITFDVYQVDKLKEIANDITILINNDYLQSDVKPFETGGRVLVPMRAIFEALDAEVLWEEATATATATNGDITVKITENQTTAYVNESPVVLDVPATIVNGRFVVPVRFISESFGAKVGWIDTRKIVTIEGGKALYPPRHNIDGALKVYDVVQSGDDGTGNATIITTLDGVFKTYWGVAYDEKNPQGAYGIYDLGKIKEVSEIKIGFFKGDGRVYSFELYASEDGVNYTKILDKTNSSGTSQELESFPVNNAKGRYIKYVGYGNNTNAWNSIAEVVIIGK